MTTAVRSKLLLDFTQPMRRRYPLESLAELRRAKVGAATGRLAEASRAREAARQTLAGAEARLGDHEGYAARVRRAESEALDQGKLCAADLARGADWALRAGSEGAALAESVRRAVQGESVAADAESVARSALASRRSEAKVVEKDATRWHAEQRKRADGREEQDASEAWRPKR
jgi:hypothetical protein